MADAVQTGTSLEGQHGVASVLVQAASVTGKGLVEMQANVTDNACPEAA